MSSTNKTALGLNMWEASDKPVRQDFVNDNVIIDEKITKLNSDLANKADKSDLALKANTSDLADLYTKSISIYGYKDLVALLPGIYVYNGWSYTSYTGVVPFTNATGTWIRIKFSDDLGIDTVIKEDGTIYTRKMGSGTWGTWTSK
ncbi:MAG: hypothetical protein ACRC36_19445 [Lacrimispora sphenoides]